VRQITRAQRRDLRAALIVIPEERRTLNSPPFIANHDTPEVSIL